MDLVDDMRGSKMPRRTDTPKQPAKKVELWSGHDVNLTIPISFPEYALSSSQRRQGAKPTLGQIREFLRAATDAGYGDETTVEVGFTGLRVRRGGQS